MLRLRTFLLVLFAMATAGVSPAAAAEVGERNAGLSDLERKLAEARRLHLINSARSRALAEEALALARERKDTLNEAAAHVELAVALRRQNQIGAALQHIREALPLVATLHDRLLLQRTLKEAGHTYWTFGDTPNATYYGQRALKLAEEDGDAGAQSDAISILGSVAEDLNDYARGRALKERALKLAEEAGDQRRIAHCAGNLGHAFFGLNDYPAARRHYERALAIFEQIQARTSADDMRMDIARVDRQEGNLDSAERTLRALLPARRQLRGRVKLTNTLVELADVLVRRGRPDEALVLLSEASGYASQLGPSVKIHVLDTQVAAHEARGDPTAALAALKQRQIEAEKHSGETAQARAVEIREAFGAERREAQIARMQETERIRNSELRAKDSELRARQAERDRAQWQNYGLFSALALGIVALGAIVSRQRLKARSDRRILEEARAAQKAAEEADRVKTRFLGIASHDIRGPLGNIIHLTAELRQEAPQNEIHAEHCDVIGSEAQRVMCLVEDLITTAALEAGRLEIRKVPMDLADAIRMAIEMQHWQADAKRQSLHFTEPPPGGGRIEGDPPRLQQVIANLLSNAIKFSPVGGEISLALTRGTNHVTLAVRDCGPGISPDDISRLFAPFERLATHPTAGETSHGLGLSIAQEIARRHGGEIRVESQPGRGATFFVTLPV